MVGTDRRAVHSVRRATNNQIISLLHKNSSCAAANVPPFCQIYFSHSCILIEQRTDALDDVEADIGNAFRAQPFQNGPTLKRDRQSTKSRQRKILIRRRRQLVVDPFFFLSGYTSMDLPERFRTTPRFSKPHDPAMLVRQVEQALSKEN